MGRKKRWTEEMQARFVEGTFARIAGTLATDEDRTDFVRGAFERALARRSRQSRSARRPASRSTNACFGAPDHRVSGACDTRNGV